MLCFEIGEMCTAEDQVCRRSAHIFEVLKQPCLLNSNYHIFLIMARRGSRGDLESQATVLQKRFEVTLVHICMVACVGKD